MRKPLTLLGAFLGAALAGAVAIHAANLSYQQIWDPSSPLVGINGIIQAINTGVTPNTMAMPARDRNYLDNGAFAVNQQGTGAITGGTTSITALQFAADRWFVSTNVTSGAGKAQIVTSSPSPPPGFGQSVKMWRDSGALLQPVCHVHEIESSRAVQLQGQPVIFSGYFQPLAGFTAASGAITVTLISGTGTDEGVGTLTASPAITPAWTGIASTALAAGTGSPTWNLGVTAAWSRVWSLAATVPVAATEVGVEVCFTPVGTASGATDGVAMTGMQLEVLGANGSAPSPFEFKPYAYVLQQAQRFFWQLNEPASGAAVNGFGQATGASATSWTVFLPQVMRGTTPVVVIPTTGTFKTNIAGTPTTWVTPTAGVCSVFACTITGGNTNTAGQAETLTGGGGSGVVYVKNDVIL